MQRARALVAVDGAQLGPPDRQVAVRGLLVLEDEHLLRVRVGVRLRVRVRVRVRVRLRVRVRVRLRLRLGLEIS